MLKLSTENCRCVATPLSCAVLPCILSDWSWRWNLERISFHLLSQPTSSTDVYCLGIGKRICCGGRGFWESASAWCSLFWGCLELLRWFLVLCWSPCFCVLGRRGWCCWSDDPVWRKWGCCRGGSWFCRHSNWLRFMLDSWSSAWTSCSFILD